MENPLVISLPFRFYPSDKEFLADYVVCTDASSKGYGAYLYQNVVNSPNKVAWFHQAYNKVNITSPACSGEMYSITEAVYTWKKKFTNSVVCVLTDSDLCKFAINNGMAITAEKQMLEVFLVSQILYMYYPV